MVSSTEETDEEQGKNICRDITAKRIRLLNAAGEDTKYGEFVAAFAYLRTREIDFENLDYDLQPAEVWNTLEAIHDMALTLYDADKKWNEHLTDATTLIYADKVSKPLLERISNLADQRRNVFVYSWAPGQITHEFDNRDIEIRSVHETLVKRFRQ